MSFVFCILLLQHLGPWWKRRDCQFLEIIKCLPTKVCFIYKPTYPQSVPPNHIPYQAIKLQATIHLPHHPRATYQTTRDGPLFNPANSNLLTLPRPFLSAETTVEALVYVLPSLPLLPDGPRVPFSIMVPTMAWSALFSWDLWITNYIFSGSHLLTVASTHLNNNKTYKAAAPLMNCSWKNNSEEFPQLWPKRMKPGFWSLQGISASLQSKLAWKTLT